MSEFDATEKARKFLMKIMRIRRGRVQQSFRTGDWHRFTWAGQETSLTSTSCHGGQQAENYLCSLQNA